MNNTIYRILLLSAIIFGAASCQQPLPEQFGTNEDMIEIGPDGGVRTLVVNSTDPWIISVSQPWISVSPASGRGPAECKVFVDSTFKFVENSAKITIMKVGDQTDEINIKVKQEPYEKMLVPSADDKNLESFADQNKRSFEIKLNANVGFDIKIDWMDDQKDWFSVETPEVEFDPENARPKSVPLKFSWTINFNENKSRKAKVSFIPRDHSENVVTHDFIVSQNGAEQIIEGIEGDKKAILAVLNAMNSSMQISNSSDLRDWSNVTLWEEKDFDNPDRPDLASLSDEEKQKMIGRVKSLRIEMVKTKEPIPYQITKLTKCEELFIYSNENSFLYSLSTGEHLSEMTQLRRLTIGAYGLTRLDPKFKNLSNLEYLNLEGNNFKEFPEILTPEAFPKLHSIMIHANQKRSFKDLSNTLDSDYAGLSASSVLPDGNLSFPERLLKWDNLDTLRLSVNYLQGGFPEMDGPDVPKWSEDDEHYPISLDTLGTKVLSVPRVLPKLKYFAVNLNRLSGKLPDWLLYHPNLDLWNPFSLVFEQEGTDSKGDRAGFLNRPSNLDYYYKEYPNKKFNPNNVKKD